jgi:hypothetical protein
MAAFDPRLDLRGKCPDVLPVSEFDRRDQDRFGRMHNDRRAGRLAAGGEQQQQTKGNQFG